MRKTKQGWRTRIESQPGVERPGIWEGANETGVEKIKHEWTKTKQPHSKRDKGGENETGIQTTRQSGGNETHRMVNTERGGANEKGTQERYRTEKAKNG